MIKDDNLIRKIYKELEIFIEKNNIDELSMISGSFYKKRNKPIEKVLTITTPTPTKIDYYYIKIKTYQEENIKKIIEFANNHSNIYDIQQEMNECKLFIADVFEIRKKKLVKLFDDEQ